VERQQLLKKARQIAQEQSIQTGDSYKRNQDANLKDGN
jgi:hypothetical protein